MGKDISLVNVGLMNKYLLQYVSLLQKCTVGAEIQIVGLFNTNLEKKNVPASIFVRL